MAVEIIYHEPKMQNCVALVSVALYLSKFERTATVFTRIWRPVYKSKVLLGTCKPPLRQSSEMSDNKVDGSGVFAQYKASAVQTLNHLTFDHMTVNVTYTD